MAASLELLPGFEKNTSSGGDIRTRDAPRTGGELTGLIAYTLQMVVA